MTKKKIITFLILALAVGAVGYYWYIVSKTTDFQRNMRSQVGNYSELTDDAVKEMGGQDTADNMKKQFEQAVKDLDGAINKYERGGKKEADKPSIALFTDVSRYAKYLHKYDFAIATMENMSSYYDKSDVALINTAHLYEDKGDYQKAIDTYQKFYATYPQADKAQFYLSIMQDYKALNNKAKVAEYYEEYKKAGFKNEEIEQYLAAQ